MGPGENTRRSHDVKGKIKGQNHADHLIATTVKSHLGAERSLNGNTPA